MEREDDPQPAKRDWLKSLPQNPYAFLVLAFLTIFSVGFGIYSYVSSQKSPELSYYVDPAKAVIVKAGQASKLSVTHEGLEIKTDISAAQIVFWNNGKGIVRASSVIDPIIIHTKGNIAILEASVRKVSREIIKLQLDMSEAKNGVVKLSFEILEKGDGGVVQIIYSGSPYVEAAVTGVVEGQKELNLIRDKNSRKEVVWIRSGGIWANLKNAIQIVFFNLSIEPFKTIIIPVCVLALLLATIKDSFSKKVMPRRWLILILAISQFLLFISLSISPSIPFIE